MVIVIYFIIVAFQSIWLGCECSNANHHSTNLARIEHKLRNDPLPLFEFAREIDEILLDPSTSITQIHVLHQSYLDSLRDHYLVKFRKESIGHNIDLPQLKHYMLKEAEAAMKAAAPSHKTPVLFLHMNHLIELEADIDNLIATEGSHFDSHAAMQANSNEVYFPRQWGRLGMWFKSPLFRRRIKWLSVQLLILSINYVQFELNRVISVWAAEKRLTEVPEFPLL